MAPPARGTKRASGASEDGSVKFLNDTLRKYGIAQSNYVSIVEAINHPLATELNDRHRKMLIAMLPQGLCVPPTERHETQEAAVKMLDQVFETIRTNMQSEVDKEVETMAQVEASRVELERSASATSASLADAVETVATCKATIARAEQAVITATNNLVDKEGAQKKADKQFEAASLEKTGLEATLAEDFKPLCDGTVETDQFKVYYDKVAALCGKLFDASLMTGLPSVLSKKPSERGSFDTMIVAQVEEALSKKIADLSTVVDHHPSETITRASAVTAAVEEKDSAESARDSFVKDLSAATASLEQCTEANRSALESLVNSSPEHKKTTDALEAKKEQLVNFNTWNVACYETLRDREVVQADKKAKTQIAGADLEEKGVPAEAGA